MSDWIYNDKPFSGNDRPDEFTARSFVYVIERLETGRKYFGKKRFSFTHHKRRSGRKNRIKVSKESDWQTYYGSNKQLSSEVAIYGEDAFKRTILRFCKSLSEASYYELKYQMENDVLLHPDKFYNEYVGGRISRRQMGVGINIEKET